MKLGNLILKYRKQKNLSQEDLAKEIGVTRQTISKWELNETSPDLKQAVKLAEIFDIDFNKIINQIKEKEPQKVILNDRIKNYTLILSLFSDILKISGLSDFFKTLSEKLTEYEPLMKYSQAANTEEKLHIILYPTVYIELGKFIYESLSSLKSSITAESIKQLYTLAENDFKSDEYKRIERYYEKNNQKFSQSFGKLIKYCKPYLPAIIIAIIFAIIVVRSMRLSVKDNNLFVMYAASGLAASVGLQAIVNMCSTLKIIPAKGMTLPFISYGGSSMLACSLAMGMLLAITRKNAVAEDKDIK